MTRPTLSARDLETQARTAGHTVRRSAQGTVVEGREGRGEHLSAERQLSAVQGRMPMLLKAWASLLRKSTRRARTQSAITEDL